MDIKITRDLDKLVRWARKNGVTQLKYGDFSIDLSPSALFPESDYKKKKASADNDPIINENTYSEEDALFWSSAGIPEHKEAN